LQLYSVLKKLPLINHCTIHIRNFAVIPRKKINTGQISWFLKPPAILFSVHLFSSAQLNAWWSSSELFKISKLERSLKFSFLPLPPFGSHIKTYSTDQFFLIRGRGLR
jgi:hypothetical protein